MKNKNKLVVIILLFAVSVAVSVFIFPTEEQFEYSYDKGAQWLYDDLYAPYDFAICRSDDDIQAEKDSIVSDFIPYYSFDTLEPRKFVNTNCTLLEKTIGEKTSLEKEEANAFAQNFKDKLSAIYEKGVINPSDKSEYVNAGNKIRVVRGNVGELDLISEFYTKSSAKEEMLAVYASDSRMYEADSLSGFYVRDFIEKTVFVTNVAIDEELNDKYLQSRIDAVLPMSGMVHKGELIISKGKVVDEHSKRLLD